MERPNFNKIAWILDYFTDEEYEKADYCFNDIDDIDSNTIYQWNDKIQELIISWADISEGRIDYPEYPELKTLLKTYDLEDILPDFRFLAFIFLDWHTSINKPKERIEKHEKIIYELLQALIFFYKEKENFVIKIDTMNAIKVKPILIKSPELIDIIKQSLFNHLQYNDFKFVKLQNYLFPKTFDEKTDNKTNWGEYFERRLHQYKRKYFSKGRPKRDNEIKKMVLTIQSYLESFTQLKAKAEATYSNDQARFIFRFLEIFDLVKKPSLGSDEADFIANNYLNKKISRNSKNKTSDK